jgi:deazaflavin-dependent oxidoreductase (nitroreductase family)
MDPVNKPDITGTAPGATTAQALMKGSTRMKPKDVFHKVSTGIHRAVFKASKGRLFGKAFGMPVIELVTTGRRSGKERSTMLAAPIADGDRLVLVASFGGDDWHPAWYLNLRANPEVRATTAGSTRTMIARTATEEERARLWPRITSVFEGYARYQERTDRPIPVVILEPKQPRVGRVRDRGKAARSPYPSVQTFSEKEVSSK